MYYYSCGQWLIPLRVYDCPLKVDTLTVLSCEETRPAYGVGAVVQVLHVVHVHVLHVSLSSGLKQ